MLPLLSLATAHRVDRDVLPERHQRNGCPSLSVGTCGSRGERSGEITRTKIDRAANAGGQGCAGDPAPVAKRRARAARHRGPATGANGIRPGARGFGPRAPDHSRAGSTTRGRRSRVLQRLPGRRMRRAGCRHLRRDFSLGHITGGVAWRQAFGGQRKLPARAKSTERGSRFHRPGMKMAQVSMR